MTYNELMELVTLYGDARADSRATQSCESSLEDYQRAEDLYAKIRRSLVENFAQMNGPPNKPPTR